MKITRAILIGAALLTLGAGCQQPTPPAAPPEQVSDINALPSAAPPPAEETPAATAPSADATTPKNDDMNKQWSFPGVLPENQISNREVRIKTDKGEIVFELFDKDAPKTVSNFVYLAKAGFYDGLTFHRRDEGFVIQGGDPNGNGTGGPGYRFPDEKVTRPYSRGIVAMANAGPDTNGSQFFIMLADTALPPKYTIFGNVTSGMDVVDKIQIGDVMRSVMVEAKAKP